MALPDLLTRLDWKESCLRYGTDICRFAFEALGMQITWQQEILFRAIAEPGSRTSVASGHGCFGKGTLVRLFDGSTKPIEAIGLDDVLVNGDGKTRIGVHDIITGQQQMFRFVYADGSSHTFNKSHILCLKSIRDWGGEQAGHTIRVTVGEYVKWSARKRAAWRVYRLVSVIGSPRPVYITIKTKRIESLGTHDYYGICVDEIDGANTFLLADNTVVHNTGKSRSAGVVALWHLLFHEKSIMMFTAPAITTLRNIVWKEISICLDKMRAGPLAWLADYVALFAQKVYIKGYSLDWYVVAKTASKSNPTTIAGQHGDNYMLWGDEASGIDDKVMEVALGALTHASNRCVLTSQPTRNAGFFYETHHRLSFKAGKAEGIWESLTFNGERSPLVSKAVLKEMLEKYGHRNDPGYMVRVRGLFPDLAGEFLVTRAQSDEMYVGRCLFPDEHDDFGYILAVDVGGGVGRDDSVITLAKVWGYKHWGPDARRVEIVDIPLCKNNDNLHELAGVINEVLVRYANVSIVLDANGAGKGLSQHLTAQGIYYKPVNWGGPCFSNENKKDYFNKRSQANVCLSRAIAQGRFKITTPKNQAKIKEQVTHVPYFFDDHTRFKVASKEDMKKKGISSPDIVDTFAFLFLEGVGYTQADEYVSNDHADAVTEEDWDEMAKIAAEIN
jgi:hypothetical protein